MEWRTEGDTAYRSAANEEFIEKNGFVSYVHRQKPKGRVLTEAIRRAKNANRKSDPGSSMRSLSRRIGWTVHPHLRDRARDGEDRTGDPDQEWHSWNAFG